MILILTNSRDETANFFEKKINSSKNAIFRFNTDEHIPFSLLSFEIKNKSFNFEIENAIGLRPQLIKSIWYRRPQAMETLINDIDSDYKKFVTDEYNKLWNGFFATFQNSKWVNHPMDNNRASLKLLQLKLASELNLDIPNTLITTNPNEAKNHIINNDKKFIIKPLSKGVVEFETGSHQLIYTSRLTKDNISKLELIRNCPTLIQEEIENKRDVRVNYFEGKFCSFFLDTKSTEVDCRRNNMQGVEYSYFELDNEVKNKICKMMQKLNLKFCTIDLAYTRERGFTFFEINPNGQWAWIEQVTNYPISQMLFEVLNV